MSPLASLCAYNVHANLIKARKFHMLDPSFADVMHGTFRKLPRGTSSPANETMPKVKLHHDSRVLVVGFSSLYLSLCPLSLFLSLSAPFFLSLHATLSIIRYALNFRRKSQYLRGMRLICNVVFYSHGLQSDVEPRSTRRVPFRSMIFRKVVFTF